MYDKLLGMLKPHVPDVEECGMLTDKLIDFIEDDREAEIKVAHDCGYDEGFIDGHDEGHDEGYEKGYNDGLLNAEDKVEGEICCKLT